MLKESIRNHHIVCGCGNTGLIVVEQLINSGHKVVIIDKSDEILKKIELFEDKPVFICGDGTEQEILISAGIKRAYCLSLILPIDKDNIFIALTAREINPTLKIVSRCNNQFKNRKKLISIGVDGIVSPNLIGGLRMVSEMVRRNVTNFLDMLIHHDDKIDVNFLEINIPLNSIMDGKRIFEIDILEKYNLSIVAIKKNNLDEYIYSPIKSTLLSSEDLVVIYGKIDKIIKLQRMIGSKE